MLFPALLVRTLAHAKLSEVLVFRRRRSPADRRSPDVRAVPCAAAVFLTRRLASAARPSRRFSKCMPDGRLHVGLAVAGSLYGNVGPTSPSAAMVAMIPLLANIMSVWVLAHYARRRRVRRGRASCWTIAKNPFIWACAFIGLALNLSGLVSLKWRMIHRPRFVASSLALGSVRCGRRRAAASRRAASRLRRWPAR